MGRPHCDEPEYDLAWVPAIPTMIDNFAWATVACRIVTGARYDSW
jgi:hypothetical protein